MVHGIVSNHGFADGNKRTALYLVELLVQRSGYEFVENDEVVADTITGVARGEIGYAELAAVVPCASGPAGGMMARKRIDEARGKRGVHEARLRKIHRVT